MNSYSHLVLAMQIETAINPEDSGEYLWGSVVPDIRYLTGMPRWLKPQQRRKQNQSGLLRR
jgi:hypothetical protein